MRTKRIGFIAALFFVILAGTSYAEQAIDVGVRYAPVMVMTGDDNSTKIGTCSDNVEPYVNYMLGGDTLKVGLGAGALIGKGPYVDSSFDASSENIFAPYLGLRGEASFWRLTLGLEGGAEYVTVPDTYKMSKTVSTFTQLNFELDQTGGGFSPYGRIGLDCRIVKGLSLGIAAEFEDVQRTIWDRGRYQVVGSSTWTNFDYGTKSLVTTWLQPSAELKYRF